jgi:hypothetical protein
MSTDLERTTFISSLFLQFRRLAMELLTCFTGMPQGFAILAKWSFSNFLSLLIVAHGSKSNRR